MPVTDAHIHYAGDHPDVLALLEMFDLKMFNICVAHDTSGVWRESAVVFRDLANRYPDRYAWCTTFDPPDYEDRGFDPSTYVESVIAGLGTDFAGGAVACKIWKNIGMSLRTPDGAFLMVDDPLFDPIYEYLASAGKPTVMHIGEPLGCWQPLDAGNPHAGYYSQHPEWYMGDKPDHPSHADLVAARDAVLARHPRLTVVGAHLGSLEYDVCALSERLDRYPNFAVDTSARLYDLIPQDRDTVREFFITYQDRILFGTDRVQRQPISELDDEVRAAHLADVAARYEHDLAFYGADVVTTDERELRGLGLPATVFDKLVYHNAQRWLPGL